MGEKKPDPTVQVSLTFNKEQIEALEKVSRRIQKCGGKRLPVNAILRSLVRLMLEMEIDPAGVKDEEELFDLLRKHSKRER